MDELSALKDKLKTTVKILQWELCDMWGHVSAKTPDGKHFLLAFLRPPADPKIPVDEVLEFDMSGTLLSGRRTFPMKSIFTCVLTKTETMSGLLFIVTLLWLSQ